MEEELNETYKKFSAVLSDLVDLEANLQSKRRSLIELKKTLTEESSDGSVGVDFSAHSFKQLSERLEELAMNNPIIYDDVFKESDPSRNLLIPSNLKSFVITMLSNASIGTDIKEEESRSGGSEYRYTININKWSSEKRLEFIAIVENCRIKTCFFNWVQHDN